jgi:aspartokinase
MKKIIRIAELIGSDIRSRKNADHIRKGIADCTDVVELDFNGVEFISRAFADEIYTIVNENRNNVVLINIEGIVGSMMSVVSESRTHKRVRKNRKCQYERVFRYGKPIGLLGHFLKSGIVNVIIRGDTPLN